MLTMTKLNDSTFNHFSLPLPGDSNQSAHALPIISADTLRTFEKLFSPTSAHTFTAHAAYEAFAHIDITKASAIND
jgi:hypothetical protein